MGVKVTPPLINLLKLSKNLAQIYESRLSTLSIVVIPSAVRSVASRGVLTYPLSYVLFS